MSDQNNNNDISLKRYAARIAMEGEAERVRREAEEKVARDKELAEEAVKQRELDKKAAEERAIKDKKEQEEKEKRVAVEASKEIKKEVEKIKTIGVQTGSLRTLKMDMDKTIREQSISIARIALEEEARRRANGETPAKQNVRKWSMIITSLVLIASGVSIGIYYFQKSKAPEEVTEVVKKTKTSISVEARKTLSLEGMTSNKIISEIKGAVSNSKAVAGTIEKIDLVKKDAEGTLIELTTQEFFSAIKASVSASMIRSFDKDMLFGVLNTITGAKSGIFFFTTEYYPNAFAGMLNWEKGSMVRDIYEIINSVPPTEFLTTKDFEDLIINNQDTRVLKNEEGKIVLVYSFLNGKDLIIAGNMPVFNELLTRLRNSPNK